MKTNIRKFPAVLLLAVLCLTVFPISAMAAGVAEVKIPVSVELSGEKPSPDETYTIILQGEDEAPMPEENILTRDRRKNVRVLLTWMSTLRNIMIS